MLLNADTLIFPTNYEHIFNSHLLQPLHQTAIFNNARPALWPALVFFLMLILIVVLKITAPGKTIRIINGSYNLQVARQLQREDYGLFKQESVLLNILYILSSAFILFKLNQLYGSILKNNSNFLQYLFFTFLITTSYTLKFIGIKLSSHLTRYRALFNDYKISVLIINQVLGLLLFPIILLAELSPLSQIWLIIPGALLLIIAYVLRLYRGVLFSVVDYGVGIIQLFLYLCTLEILPLLVLIKFLIVNF